MAFFLLVLLVAAFTFYNSESVGSNEKIDNKVAKNQKCH